MNAPLAIKSLCLRRHVWLLRAALVFPLVATQRASLAEETLVDKLLDSSWGEYALEEDQPPGVLVAPGPNTPQVIDFLEEIRDGALAHDRAIENVRVSGRVSNVSRRVDKDSLRSVDLMDLPTEWTTFKFLRAGDRWRYEEPVDVAEYAHSSAIGPSSLIRIYLGSRDSTLRLLTNGFEVERPLQSLTDIALNQGLSGQFDLVYDGPSLRVLSEAIDVHLQRLAPHGGDGYFERTGHRIRCYRDNGLMVVDLVRGPQTPLGNVMRNRAAFWVDPIRGYRVVARRSQLGHEAEDTVMQAELVSLEYQEVEPGHFWIAKGEWASSDFGGMGFGPRGLQPQKQGVWARRVLQIDSVEFGDFPIDDALFDPDSLPIPKGMVVYDERSLPPPEVPSGGAQRTTFLFSDGALSAQLLKASRAEHETPDRPGMQAAPAQ